MQSDAGGAGAVVVNGESAHYSMVVGRGEADKGRGCQTWAQCDGNERYPFR